MSPSYAARKSVAVIGGGVVGLCVALAHLERNFDVSVIERQDLVPAASWGNAGRSAVELSEPLASLATLLSLPRL